MMPPDGFVSSVLAVESFQDMKVLLHGPVGCRRDLSFISSILCPKENKADMSAYRVRYYANSPRVPCTEVDAEDYIAGAIDRLREALAIVSSVDDDCIAVVSTPGISLIGESCEDVVLEMGLQNKTITLDADYISIPIGEGYDRTLTKILKWQNPEKKGTIKGTVNLLGLSVFTRDWDATLADLTILLEAMGLKIACAPGVGCSLEQFRRSVDSEFNVVVCSEYCNDLKDYYRENYGIESIDIHEAPVGFDAIRRWIWAISEACSVDPEPAMKILDERMDRAFRGMHSNHGHASIKGRKLGIVGDSTIVLPLSKWLYDYLSMVPAYVRVTEGEDTEAMSELTSFLESIGCDSALTDPLPEDLCVMAGDGDTVMRMEIGGRCEVGLDIGYPSLYDSNFMSKNVIGQNGALYILERIVNSRPMM